jgi:hypothetical protein
MIVLLLHTPEHDNRPGPSIIHQDHTHVQPPPEAIMTFTPPPQPPLPLEANTRPQTSRPSKARCNHASHGDVIERGDGFCRCNTTHKVLTLYPYVQWTRHISEQQYLHNYTYLYVSMSIVRVQVQRGGWTGRHSYVHDSTDTGNNKGNDSLVDAPPTGGPGLMGGFR